MSKLLLNPEALVVETFDVERTSSVARGTVHGRQPTYGESCTCVDCGPTGFIYSCQDTQCPSGCAIITCDTYEQCVNPTNPNTCNQTCGCSTAICPQATGPCSTCVAGGC
jgi:hypothetical protein